VKRPVIVEAIVFFALLVAGVSLRVWFQHLPNFAPVAAIALFAGFFFRSWLVAASLPLTVMGVSNYFIGGYDALMMLLVNATLALPVVCRPLLRRSISLSQNQLNYRYIAGVLGSSVAGSVLFFLVSNFGSWLGFDMYEASLAGIGQCYLKALPFFRYTLAGDLFFTVALFGGHTIATRFGLLLHHSPALHRPLAGSSGR
jgi:hypothetical protein